MAEILTRGDMIRTIEKMAVEYARDGINSSLHRNSHLTGMHPESTFTEEHCYKILVDFINNAGAFQGLDYALTLDDFQKQVSDTTASKTVKLPKTEPDNIIDLNL